MKLVRPLCEASASHPKEGCLRKPWRSQMTTGENTTRLPTAITACRVAGGRVGPSARVQGKFFRWWLTGTYQKA